jgi:hypothetical protein
MEAGSEVAGLVPVKAEAEGSAAVEMAAAATAEAA